MSLVYRAEQRSVWHPRRSVALKIAAPRFADPASLVEAEQRLAHEAILLRLIDHWRVPRALALFEEYSRLHLAMDFVPGATLDCLLSDPVAGAPAPWLEPSVIALGYALADLLAYLHAGPAPILVRDLKPSNLIVTPAGHLMLIDLGIACWVPRGQRVPSAERRLGTPGYAAPEQYAGDGCEDEREDLYALGAVLYRVATGQTPPGAVARLRDPDSLLPARTLNPTVSPRLDTLLAQLLAVQPAHRPPSAADVAGMLAAWRRAGDLALPVPVARLRA
jgi:serine/threonine protein kinase